jgi:quercetin dioxygenase-like cupin family protein
LGIKKLPSIASTSRRNNMRKAVTHLSLCLMSLLALPVVADEKPVATAAEKKPSLVAPLSTGYEAAIAAHAAKPIFRPAGTAPAVYGPGDLYSLLVTGKESNNVFFQFEAVVPEGGGPPPHVHSREDETFYIVRGSLEILLGDRTHLAKAGDFVYIPRGTVHRFKNVGSGSAVQLVTFSPAGIEKFFQEVFPAVKDRKAAPPLVTDELIRKINEAAPKYGLKFIPPADSGKR